ncbi:fatty acid desaturase family protein [Nocardia aurantia]|uniref:NADPH-dependent stearoyl-CoA 9-desaturase n=1 Tax=Nocardia aurantia TaxID=2585199 RepID=A0A7K0DSP6_9NOCA|nr:fatty acid desaturase [Nocardia aurantia]MQY28795.1 NADPH-dependent stearoyl-CoA 9-desaturase [Nocardia aurantia]
MAIAQVAAYARLSDAQIAALGSELDAIRGDVLDARGSRDAVYIRRTIAFQRTLDVAARLLIAMSRGKLGWAVGTAGLAVAKIVENMEIGHNVSHGQWDWMNDPEIHSSTWEWDMAALSAQWRYAHNYRHHVYTNVLDMDDDIGFGVMRMSRDQQWRPYMALQPLQNLVLALTFEWGIALHGLYSEFERSGPAARAAHTKAFLGKAVRQIGKDYLLFPAISGRRWRRTLGAAATANIVRNVWAHTVIFCGHFPDGAEKFTAGVVEEETEHEWYLRQLLGSANFTAGPVLAFLSGNLCYQIEHHLFPELPSNRYAGVAVRVRELCEKYDLPYTSGSLPRQYLSAMRTLHKLAVPNRWLRATCDDAPETASELRGTAPGDRKPSRRNNVRTAWRRVRALA